MDKKERDAFKNLMKTMKLAIKNQDINGVINIINNNTIYNSYSKYRDEYLITCIKHGTGEIFKLLLNEKKRLTYHDIREIYQHFKKEPYMELILQFLEENPEHENIDKIYSLILAFTIRWNYKNKERIEYLSKLKILDFENKIKDPIYLYNFLEVVFRRWNLRKKTINEVIEFFTPYFEKNIIDKEVFLSILLNTYKSRETVKLTKHSKEIFKDIDVHKKVKLAKYNMLDDILYFGWSCYEHDVEYCEDENCIKKDNEEKIKIKNIMDEFTEVELGSIFKLKQADLNTFTNVPFEYEVNAEDKLKIDDFCMKYKVKNIGESNKEFFKRLYEDDYFSSDESEEDNDDNDNDN